MSQTFGDCWRKVRLHLPDAPFGLVREWTLQAYKELCERRPWVWTTVEYQLQTLASRTLTVTFTAQSATITSAAGFVASDQGRQIKVSSIPIYTIIEVVDASTATLDQPYTATAGAQTATIFSGYLTMPADFGSFMLVTDPYNQRLIGWWYTQEELGRLDPARTSSDGTPRGLVARKLSPALDSLGQYQFEWWPSPTQAKAFPSYYRARPQDLQDTDVLRGALAERSDILREGALMFASKWPGTAAAKNPYFSLAAYKLQKDAFEQACAKLELRDDDMAQQTWSTLPYHRWATWDLSVDGRYLRMTDATVADYRYA